MRQSWFGSSADFAGFPLKSELCEAFENADAYKFLLKLNLGLLTPRTERVGETEVNGNFYKGWSSLMKSCPERINAYGQFIQNLTADERTIRSNLFEGLKIKRMELSARDLSGFEHEDTVLIVGNEGPGEARGKLSKFTDGIARAVTINDKHRAKEVCITHPDAEILKKMHSELLKLQADGKVNAKITAVPFEYLDLAFDFYDKTSLVAN